MKGTIDKGQIAWPECWVIFAQLLVLIVLGMGVLFVLWTTPGTLFLFSAVAPPFAMCAIVIVLSVAVAALRKRHRLFHVETLQPGQTVFREGDPGDFAYFIQKGEVEVLRHEGGNECMLRHLLAGDFFGEVALLSDQTRRVTVRAVTRTQVAAVAKGDFLRMLFAVPSARDEILVTAAQRVMREGNARQSIAAPARAHTT